MLYKSGEIPIAGDVVRCLDICDSLKKYCEEGNRFTVNVVSDSEPFIDCVGLPSGGWRTSRFELIHRAEFVQDTAQPEMAAVELLNLLKLAAENDRYKNVWIGMADDDGLFIDGNDCCRFTHLDPASLIERLKQLATPPMAQVALPVKFLEHYAENSAASLFDARTMDIIRTECRKSLEKLNKKGAP